MPNVQCTRPWNIFLWSNYYLHKTWCLYSWNL